MISYLIMILVMAITVQSYMSVTSKKNIAFLIKNNAASNEESARKCITGFTCIMQALFFVLTHWFWVCIFGDPMTYPEVPLFDAFMQD